MFLHLMHKNFKSQKKNWLDFLTFLDWILFQNKVICYAKLSIKIHWRYRLVRLHIVWLASSSYPLFIGDDLEQTWLQDQLLAHMSFTHYNPSNFKKYEEWYFFYNLVIREIIFCEFWQKNSIISKKIWQLFLEIFCAEPAMKV
jgi:hypothetical protein